MGGGCCGFGVVRSVCGVRGEWRRGGKRGSFVCVSATLEATLLSKN
jgi:hypothetical protein